MTANLLIFLGAAASILVLLDMLMSDTQKNSLKNWTVRFSVWMRGSKARLIAFLQSGPSLNIDFAAGVFVSIALSAGNAALALFFDAPFNVALIASGLTAPIAFFILRFLTILQEHTQSIDEGEVASNRSLHVIVWAVSIVLLAVPIWVAAWVGQSTWRGMDILQSWGPVTFELLNVTVGLLLLWLVTLLLLVGLNLVVLILWTSDFLLRRIAEYPKGPLLAASLIFTSLAAILKSISWD